MRIGKNCLYAYAVCILFREHTHIFFRNPVLERVDLASFSGVRAVFTARIGCSAALKSKAGHAAENNRAFSGLSRDRYGASPRYFPRSVPLSSPALGSKPQFPNQSHRGTVAVREVGTASSASAFIKDETAGCAEKQQLRFVPVPISVDPPALRKAAVLDVVRKQVLAHNDAFYVVDLSEIAHKLNEWYSQLPRVRPYYAVKCNDDPHIVSTLAGLGAGFDCATKGEMSMVLGLGVNPEDVIFAHPAKQPSHIQYARDKGVAKMTFDNEEELRKIGREFSGAKAVLRILTDDSHSVCRLGLKFGAPISSVRYLLSVAKQVGVSVIGVSYHVGSGNGNAQSFADAVRDARSAFDIAEQEGMPMKLLDIGGGFPGSELGNDITAPGGDTPSSTLRAIEGDNPYSKHPTFKVIAGHVRAALDKYFPPGCGVKLIAEPGRFFVKSSHTLAVNVVGKRPTLDEASSRTRYNYYVNDGLYGSFNCILYDHVTMTPQRVLPAVGTGRVELDLAALAAARIALAATGDDSVARLGADGTPVVQDAVGLGTAVELAATLAEGRATQESTVLRRMSMGGESQSIEDEEEVEVRSMGGAGKGGGTRVAFTPASTHARAASTSTHSISSSVSASALPVVHPTTLWGPTCDSMDKISDAALLPELAVGDWLVFDNAGAYTIAGSCKFNGFPLSTKVYRHLDGRLEVQREEVLP